MESMAKCQQGAALRCVQTLFNIGTIGELTDGQLLERFTARSAQAAEPAFTALVERHGAMVMRVCRGVLHDHHDAQDAFQATFLVLVRRAGSLWVKDSLGPWLHQVAFRTASCARSAAIRRRHHEGRAGQVVAGRTSSEEIWDDTGAVLHEELVRLPERYRQAIVLCVLEDLTPEQAARRLGWPVGTVQSRLARGRRCLRDRLIRRGLAPTGVVLAGTITTEAAALCVPPGVAKSTALEAVRFLAGKSAIESVSAPAVALTEGVLKMMFLSKLKIVAAVLVALAVGAAGGSVLSSQSSGEKLGETPAAKGAQPKATEPAVEDPSSPPEQRATELAQRLRTELDYLSLGLKRKQVELQKAIAQRELLLAVVATQRRLNERRPGMVSIQEQRKAEADVEVANAQVELAQIDVREAELRLDQARLLEGNPARLREYFERWGHSDPLALEKRLRDVERKLEQVLKAIEGSARGNPVGDFPPQRR
jgi:RNA polymerase sigma factor (sigma-70 family)